MTHFLGTHTNRIDAKGRVSVPASFRAALRRLDPGEEGIRVVLRPSIHHPCLEGWPMPVFETLEESLGSFPILSEDYSVLSTTLFDDAQLVEADKEGRIVLPEGHAAHADLSSSVVFMGLGRVFQIWEPEAAARRRVQAREAARQMTFAPRGAA